MSITRQVTCGHSQTKTATQPGNPGQHPDTMAARLLYQVKDFFGEVEINLHGYQDEQTIYSTADLRIRSYDFSPQLLFS